MRDLKCRYRYTPSTLEAPPAPSASNSGLARKGGSFYVEYQGYIAPPQPEYGRLILATCPTLLRFPVFSHHGHVVFWGERTQVLDFLDGDHGVHSKFGISPVSSGPPLWSSSKAIGPKKVRTVTMRAQYIGSTYANG